VKSPNISSIFALNHTGPTGTPVEYTGTGPYVITKGIETTFTLNVSDTGQIVKFTSVTLTGFKLSADSNINLSIEAPDHTIIVLINKTGQPGWPYNGDFGAYSFSRNSTASATLIADGVNLIIAPGDYRSNGDLNGFNGKAMNGNWVLHCDNYDGLQDGSLASFTIKLSYN
jgi:hypothetical protein